MFHFLQFASTKNTQSPEPENSELLLGLGPVARGPGTCCAPPLASRALPGQNRFCRAVTRHCTTLWPPPSPGQPPKQPAFPRFTPTSPSKQRMEDKGSHLVLEENCLGQCLAGFLVAAGLLQLLLLLLLSSVSHWSQRNPGLLRQSQTRDHRVQRFPKQVGREIFRILASLVAERAAAPPHNMAVCCELAVRRGREGHVDQSIQDHGPITGRVTARRTNEEACLLTKLLLRRTAPAHGPPAFIYQNKVLTAALSHFSSCPMSPSDTTSTNPSDTLEA